MGTAPTRRILVIDDNRDIHDDFRKVFESVQHDTAALDTLEADLFGDETVQADAPELIAVEIDSAYQGEDGVRMAVAAAQQGRPYDVAFVDVRMPPGMDGIQTIKQMWNSLGDLQCVICTAFSDYDWEEILQQLGKSRNLLILKKPFDPVEVLQLAQSLGEKAELSRATRDYQDRLERQVETLMQAEGELRTSNEQLEAARCEAEAASRAKSEFLANISHELRTPLNAVIGMLQLLLDTQLDAQQHRYVSTAKTSGETLLELINEVLDFSKVEAGKVELEEIGFCLSDVIEPVISVVAYHCSTKNIELGCFVDQFPAGLRGDPARLRQILTNLANNAVKFTEHGTIIIRAVVAEETGDRVVVRFAVEDTGIGIPQDRMDRLFQSFSQVDASTTRNYGGTGLGLAICKQLCELMHGEIGVESTAGVGSTFWFTVPLKKPLPNDDQPARMPELQKLNVLVIDRNPRTCQVLQEQLEAWRCSTAAATDVASAFERVERASAAGGRFDVVLLDAAPDDAKLQDFLQACRSRRLLEELKLVGLTPIGCSGTDVSRLLEMGIADCLTKPVRQSELYNALLHIIAGDAGISQTAERLLCTGRHQSRCLPKSDRSGVRLLLAEDNSINQMVAQEILSRAGYECDIVSNGSQAVDALQRQCYHAVLMDCQMPIMDGFEATRRIRAEEASRGVAASQGIPIIALTANAMKRDRDQCLEAGMTEYLSKPLNPNKLIGMIEQTLDRAEGAARPAEERREASPSGPAPSEAVSSGKLSFNETADGDPSIPVLDYDSLLHRCMDDERLLVMILIEFQKECPKLLERIDRALSDGDASELASASHTLKGMAGNVSADRL